MSEASDLLLRMGRLVWDNPQWTPARADRAPRRDPAALAPGNAAFTAVVSAAHQAADALARAAPPILMPCRPPPGPDGCMCRPGRCPRVRRPRAFAPALTDPVRDLHDTYHGAAEASTHAARELGELAITLDAPSKALALARAAVPDPVQRRGRSDVRSRRDLPRAGLPFTDPRPAPCRPGP